MNKVVLSAALAIVSGAAFAQMTAVEDEVLSAQTGQDGISIALNVRAHIDAFEWIDTDTAGGAVRFENIAIGSGTLSATGGGSYGGLNALSSTDGIQLAARTQYSTGIRFGGPINIDVEDVADFSFGGAQLIAAAGGANLSGDGTFTAQVGTNASYDAQQMTANASGGTYGYTAHVPTVGTKAVVIGLPRMVMSFNVGAIRVVPAAVNTAIADLGQNSIGGADTYSMGGIRVTNFDFSSTKVAIWGHK
jgi:hypothetical protein